MADEWGVPEVNEWWLPDENLCPPVVRSVRAFMEDRVPQAEAQSRSEDQRTINGVFSKLSFGESPASKQEGDKIKGLTTSTILNQARTLADDSPSLPGLIHDFDIDMVSDDLMLQQSQDSFYNHAGE